MTERYLPTTPPEARVRPGHFGAAVMPPPGVVPGPVYVFTASIRIWHWVTMLAIIVLCVTGYFIGSPLPSVGGEAHQSYLFGWIRFTHFAAGMILGAAFLLRVYAFIVGGHHARQIFYIPFWRIGWWKAVLGEVKWYLFVGRPKEYIGHDPLAQFAMFTMFMLPLTVLLLAGFALFAEQMGTNSGWYSVFGWVFSVLGESMTVRLWKHVAMWVVIIFSIVHVYMVLREDMTHRQTTVSSMVSGWRFYR